MGGGVAQGVGVAVTVHKAVWVTVLGEALMVEVVESLQCICTRSLHGPGPALLTARTYR